MKTKFRKGDYYGKIAAQIKKDLEAIAQKYDLGKLTYKIGGKDGNGSKCERGAGLYEINFLFEKKKNLPGHSATMRARSLGSDIEDYLKNFIPDEDRVSSVSQTLVHSHKDSLLRYAFKSEYEQKIKDAANPLVTNLGHVLKKFIIKFEKINKQANHNFMHMKGLGETDSFES